MAANDPLNTPDPLDTPKKSKGNLTSTLKEQDYDPALARQYYLKFLVPLFNDKLEQQSDKKKKQSDKE